MRRHFLLMMLLSMLFPMALSAAVIQLPETGQDSCRDVATNSEIPCSDPRASGQDGAVRAGVGWPGPRFVNNGNGTISDMLTGLIWAKDLNVMASRDPYFDGDQEWAAWNESIYDGKVNWQHALDYVAKLNRERYLGFNDWQLPNIEQLRSLNDYKPQEYHCTPDMCESWLAIAGFINVPKHIDFNESTSITEMIWSSSTFAGYSDNAWVFVPFPEYLSNAWELDDKGRNNYVWPVRASQVESAVISLPRTGQTISYAIGDDGYFKRGTAWPVPRFTINGNDTVTDNLTGLVWAKNGNIMASRDPSFDTDEGDWNAFPGDGKVTQQHAFDYIAKLNRENYLGFNDWRLPNVNELASLSNAQKESRANWLNGLGFVNVQALCQVSTLQVYRDIYGGYDTYRGYVWPVRSGWSSSELVVIKTGTGIGEVSPDSGSLAWDEATGKASYPETSLVTLTATPVAGNTFDGWSGACTGTGICRLAMNSNQRVTAIFNKFTAAIPASITVPSVDADGNYTVSWGPSTTVGVTYELQEATNPNFIYGLRTAYSGSGLSTAISGRGQNATYYYRVKAKKTGYLDSAWKTSSVGSAIPGSMIVAAPANITVPSDDIDGAFTVSWGASPTASVGYVLEEATNPTFFEGVVTVYAGAGLSVNITGRTLGKTYYYRVKAIKPGLRDSTWKLPIKGCAVPGRNLVGAPGALAVPEAVPDGPYAVSWGASETVGVSYLLQEATNDIFTQNLRTAYFGTATSKMITGRTPARIYYYRVQAMRAGDIDSGKRTAANGCRVRALCADPASLFVPAADADGSYPVRWGGSTTPGVTYELQEATNSTFTIALRTVYTGTATNLDIAGRSQNLTYYYRVRATKSGNAASSWRIAANGCALPGTVQAAAPASITVPTADADGAYTVSWGSSPTAGVSYELQEATVSTFTEGLRTAYRGTSLACRITRRSQNVTYYYRIRAVKAGLKDSGYHIAASGCAVPGMATVGTPNYLDVPTSDPDGTYLVDWYYSDTAGATYELQEATNSSFTSGLRLACRGMDTRCTVTGRNAGKTYYYRVRAVKSGFRDSNYQTTYNGCQVGP